MSNERADDTAEVKLNRLMSLVRDMRDAQKEYFRSRDPAVLQRSKSLERKVDEFCDEVDSQMRLF